MLPLVVPTADSGIHLVKAAAAAACMCPAVAGTVLSAEVVVTPDMHCLPVVGVVTVVVVVVDVVAIAAAYVAGDATVAVSVAAVVAGAVVVGVATLTALPDAAPYMPLACTAQTFPYPYVLSLSNHVLRLFHQATSCAARACMHLRLCGPHQV